MGNPEQFIHEVDLLELEVRKLGLKWIMVPRERWHDYREVDAIVAVRPDQTLEKPVNPIGRFFRRGSSDISPILSPERKPASKLCNAWIAGTPAILSPDSAFQELRKSSLDYLEACDVHEIVERLKQLQDDYMLRRAIAENGKRRAVECSPDKLVRQWTDILEKRIIPAYGSWKKSSLYRKLFFLVRNYSFKILHI